MRLRRPQHDARGHAVSPRDVYIVGTTYSGSTLLGNALNGHSLIEHVGEVSRLPGFDLGPDDVYCPICTASQRECPRWSGRFVAEVVAGGASSALDRVRRATGSPIVVDGSKYVEWLRRATDEPEARARAVAIVSVRNPFAFADSMRRQAGTDGHTAGAIWRDTLTDALRTVSRLSLPSLVVRYEDLALSPEPSLRDVCKLVGVEFEPSMLTFWEVPLHTLGGNGGAVAWYEPFRSGDMSGDEERIEVMRSYRERTFGGWVDDKWRRNLDEAAISSVLATPGIHDAAHLAGYDLVRMTTA